MPHDFKNFPELTNNQMKFYYFDSPHKQITENFTARVVKVIDGDTIRVKWDERNFDFPVRLSFIDAPEREFVEGVQSMKWLEREILGQDVDIIINPTNRVEKWGRILGEIISGGLNINELSLLFKYSERFEDASSTFIKT